LFFSFFFFAQTAENGENLQILHYEPTQEFKEHHDYFDPATDPPGKKKQG
jgi:hypothetical protein